MDSLNKPEILASFLRRQRKLVILPHNLEVTVWKDLDFLGWVDIGTSRGFIVSEHRGNLKGLVLKRFADADPNKRRASMCSLCKTIHGNQGVRSFVTEDALS